jgi:hypothetical protein
MVTTPKQPEATRPLTKKQRNDVFEWVRAFGWRNEEFHWGKAQIGRTKEILPALLYKADEEYHFAIDPMARDYVAVRFRPGVDEYVTEEDGLDWPDVAQQLVRWLGALREELEAPDLWAELAQTPEVLETGDPDHNDPLTPAEIRAIGDRIDQARAFLEAAELQPETLADANRKLDYLMSATSRLGRFDWRNLAVGIVFSIAVAAAFDPNRAREMFDLLLGGVRMLLGSG